MVCNSPPLERPFNCSMVELLTIGADLLTLHPKTCSLETQITSSGIFMWMGNVVLPVQSLGCCSTWTFCQDRNGRDLPFGSWFLSCPGRSSHSPAEAIIAFFFEYLLIFLVKYFLLVYANTNYF